VTKNSSGAHDSLDWGLFKIDPERRGQSDFPGRGLYDVRPGPPTRIGRLINEEVDARGTGILERICERGRTPGFFEGYTRGLITRTVTMDKYPVLIYGSSFAFLYAQSGEDRFLPGDSGSWVCTKSPYYEKFIHSLALIYLIHMIPIVVDCVRAFIRPFITGNTQKGESIGRAST
jgi:hypothetical protein